MLKRSSGQGTGKLRDLARKIEVVTKPHTDLWQRIYCHFRNDHAPVLQMSTDERFFAFAVKTAFADSHHRFDQTEKPPEAYTIRFRRFYWVWARKKPVQSFSSQAMPAAVRCAAWWEWLPGCS